jgi:PKD domain
VQLGNLTIDSLHLSTSSIAQMLRDYHASSTIQHNRVVGIGNEIFEFNIGAVRDVSIDKTKRRGSGRRGTTAYPGRAIVPVAFNFRNAEVLADPGTNGSAIINVAMVFEFPVHRGIVPAHLYNHIRIDCSPTDTNDIKLFGLSRDREAEVATLLVQFVHRDLGGTFPLPRALGPLASSNEPVEVLTYVEPVEQIAIRSAPAKPPKPPKQESTPAESPAEVTVFGPGNAGWAAFISEQSLRPELAKLGHGIRGILEADSTTKEKTSVMLQDGCLSITSSSRSRDDAQRTGTWEMRIGLTTATVQGNRVCVAQSLGPTGNYAREEKEIKICNLVTEILSPIIFSATTNVEQSDFRLHGEVKDVAGAGRLRNNPDILKSEGQSARFLYAEIRRNGLLFHGVVDQVEAPSPPVAEFRYLRTPSSWTQFTFNAMTCWSPGCEITELRWDFGDGVTLSSSKPHIEFVVSHTFKRTGKFDVVLRIKDSLGRIAERKERINVGQVALEIGGPVAIGPNKYRTAISLKSGNTPVPRMTLQLATPHGNRELTADQDGRIILDDDQVLLARTLTRQWSQDLTDGGTVSVETAEGRVEWPVGIIDGESYARIVNVIQLCDRVLSEIYVDPIKDTQKEHLQSLLMDLKEGLLHGNFSGPAPLLDLYVPPTQGVRPELPERRQRLEALHVSLERLAKR